MKNDKMNNLNGLVQEDNTNKKIFNAVLLIIVLLVIVFLIVNKSFSNISDKPHYNLNNTEIIYEEDPGEQIFIKDADVNDIKRIKGKTNVYIFWGEGCPHCEEAFKYFESIREEYGDYFNLYGFETWNNSDNASLLEKFGEVLNIKPSGVPFIVIGDEYYIGFIPETSDVLLKAIKDNRNKGNDIYFSKVK
jgi:thiol-disulfide isomerase/thioredoxin